MNLELDYDAHNSQFGSYPLSFPQEINLITLKTAVGRIIPGMQKKVC